MQTGPPGKLVTFFLSQVKTEKNQATNFAPIRRLLQTQDPATLTHFTAQVKFPPPPPPTNPNFFSEDSTLRGTVTLFCIIHHLMSVAPGHFRSPHVDTSNTELMLHWYSAENIHRALLFLRFAQQHLSEKTKRLANAKTKDTTTTNPTTDATYPGVTVWGRDRPALGVTFLTEDDFKAAGLTELDPEKQTKGDIHSRVAAALAELVPNPISISDDCYIPAATEEWDPTNKCMVPVPHYIAQPGQGQTSFDLANSLVDKKASQQVRKQALALTPSGHDVTDRPAMDMATLNRLCTWAKLKTDVVYDNFEGVQVSLQV